MSHWTNAMMILRTSRRITLVRSRESTWLLVVALAMASTAMSSNLECMDAVDECKITNDKSTNEFLSEEENILTD
jgi:hypothetical protein